MMHCTSYLADGRIIWLLTLIHLISPVLSGQDNDWEVRYRGEKEGRSTRFVYRDVRLLYVTDDSLYVVPARGDTMPVAIPVASLLDVRRVNKGLTPFRGVTFGLVAGGGLGFVTGRALDAVPPERGERETNYTPGLAIGGAILGAFIGGLGARSDDAGSYDLQYLSAQDKVTTLRPLIVNGRAPRTPSDVVLLKNGTTLRGRVTEVIPDSIMRLEAGDGSLFVLEMHEVARVEKERVPVQASPPREHVTGRGPRAQLSFLAGHGMEDGYNFGLGARIGRTASSGLYVGLLFVYHFGKSVGLGPAFGNTDVTLNSFYLGPELGYDARPGERLVVRPYLNFGYFNAITSWDFNGDARSDDEARFYVAPGLVFNILVDRKGTIGVDTRYVIITGERGSDASALGVFLVAGVRL